MVNNKNLFRTDLIKSQKQLKHSEKHNYFFGLSARYSNSEEWHWMWLTASDQLWFCNRVFCQAERQTSGSVNDKHTFTIFFSIYYFTCTVRAVVFSMLFRYFLGSSRSCQVLFSPDSFNALRDGRRSDRSKCQWCLTFTILHSRQRLQFFSSLWRLVLYIFATARLSHILRIQNTNIS